MPRSPFSSRLHFALSLGALLLAGAPASAQSAKWDQAAVTALAVELSEVVVSLQSEFRRQPLQPTGSGQARARASFQDSLRVLRTESRALASELEAGAGLDDTWPIARRLRTVVRDLRDEGRKIGWKEPVAGHARRAEELLAKLAPFYFDANTPVEPAPAS